MNNKENQIGYKFSILSEDVATQDLFEDKTHERVSENLFHTISHSSKGVTIGLEGSWGSGKSTVIKLLKDKLTHNIDEKNQFFMFDAWAHDGDPLRRIFLESLIRSIDPEEQDNDLQDIKNRITGRKKTVEVKAKKSTSRLGKFISLSALLLPLGSALLSKVNYDNLIWPWSEHAQDPYFQFILGLIFCLSPLFVLIYWCFCGDKDEGTGETSWEFFSIDSKEDYTQDITEDGERTSIEFEDHFQKIIQTSMNKGLINKCIVVIDNLDRIDPAHAKNIWSTLQTFFQKRSNGNVAHNWSDKLWFVIPFDRDGFIKIWSASETNTDIATSFLKKCFQLIAEVPQPVMSAWSEYAKKSIEDALAQWPKHERQIVYLTFVRYLSQLDKSPTPRDIKAIVNQVGLLGAMWGGQVSTEAICLYVLFKDSLSTSQLRQTLISGSLPKEYQPDTDRTAICAEIAGLLFGVNKNKGLQLLLGPEINEAFKTGNGEALSKLVYVHGDAFWIAYEASKKNWMLGYTHTDDYKIEFTKAFHSGLLEHKALLTRDIETISRLWSESFMKFDFSRTDYSKSMDAVLDLAIDQAGFLSSLHNFASGELEKLISQIGKSDFSVSAIKNFSLLIDLLKARENPLPKCHYATLNAQMWKVWLDLLKEHELNIEIVLPNDGAIRDLTRDAQFSSANLDLKTIDYMTKTYDLNPEAPDWESVAEQMVSWMKLPSRDFDCSHLYLLATKFSLNKNEEIFSKITDCVQNEEFWTAGQSLSSFENHSLAVLAAISFEKDLQEKPFVSPSIKSFWSEMLGEKSRNMSLGNMTFNRLKELNRLDVLWMLCRDERNKLAIQIVRNSGDSALFSNWAGAAYIDEFYWGERDEIETIAKKLIENGAFSDNEQEMKGKATTYDAVYKIFYAVGDPNVCTFIDSEINQLNKDTWLECLKNDGALLALVNEKNHQFSDALAEFLVGLVSLEINIQPELVPKIPNLLNKVADLDKIVIPKVLNAYISAGRDYLNEAEFEAISPFFNSHLLRINENQLMARLNSWIDEDAKERIQWLLEQKLRPLAEPLESLLSRVRSGLQSTEPIKSEIAKSINNRFNLGVVIEEVVIDEVEEMALEGTTSK